MLALHLRPGTREWFHAWLAREHPGLVERYAALYRRGAYVDAAYRRDLAARAGPMLERHGLTGGGHAMGGRQGGAPSVPEPVVTAPAEQLSLL